MQIFQTLEQYIEASKASATLPYSLKYFLKTRRQKTYDLTTRPGHIEKGEQTFRRKEDLGCVPIVSNHKWMDVILDAEIKESESGDLNSETVPLEMVKKVIHEVNTPLGIIKNYIHILSLKLAEQDIAHHEIQIIKEEIDRVSQLINKLTHCKAEKTEISEPVNINAQLIDLVKIIRKSLPQDPQIKICLDIANSLPLIFAEKDSIRQIFLNLMKNSIEAMPHGGRLHIKTRCVPQKSSPSPDTCCLHSSNGSLEIIFSDSGIGIPSEIKSAIFDPFVSSKKRGSGLGLSVVKDLVVSLRGSIACTNNKNEGATFRINFPINKPVLQPQGSAA